MNDIMTVSILSKNKKLISFWKQLFLKHEPHFENVQIYYSVEQLACISTPIFIDLTSFSLQQLQQYLPLNASWIAVCPENAHIVKALFQLGALDVILNETDETQILQAKQILYNKFYLTTSKQKENLAIIRSSLAYELLYGGIHNPKELLEKFALAEIDHSLNLVLIIHLNEFSKFATYKSKNWQWSIRQQVAQTIESFFKMKKIDYLIAPVAINKIAVLVGIPLKNNAEQYQLYLNALSVECQQTISIQSGYSITIGIGNIYYDPRNLAISYQEAYEAQEYRLFHTGSSIIFYADIMKNNDTNIVNVDWDTSQLEKLINIGNFQEIQNEFEQLKEKLFTFPLKSEILYSQINKVLSKIAEIAVQKGGNEQRIMELILKAKIEIKLLENAKEIQHTLSKAFMDILDEIMASTNEKRQRSIQQAINYMDNNFNKPITLDEVAQYINLNTNYFSNIFKKEIGQTFSDYLSHLRITKSKHLLMQLDLTIYQIATMVGYNDSRYFSRVFKNQLGLTPSEYRNSILNKNINSTD